jgi:DNA polymerase-1
MTTKLKRIVKSIAEKGDNPWEKWKAVKEGKEVVEDVLGPMQEGELCDIPWDDAVYYSARDADATIRIYPILWSRIQSLDLEGTFWRDMRMMPMVVDMMANGMPVNLKSFEALSAYFQNRMDYIQRKIQAMVGHHMKGKSLNPGSYLQMSELLYDKLAIHLKGGRFRAKKAATDKSTANDILMRYIDIHPVIQEIIDWREYQKLKTSYADTIPKKVVNGRIHTTLRITRVATGRISSSNPNLMAQPQRSEEGRKVRDCYETEDGQVFISGDYSQVEMRGAASDAKDEKMMEIFWKGLDIHSITASEMFGIRVEDLDEMKHRYPAKRVGFGILNLITASGLQRELSTGGASGWTVEDCEKMIKAWFGIYKGIAAYMKANGEYARRYGYVRDMWGRIRYIPGIRSDNKWVRIEAERQAGNAPIQMGAQGIIKEAMGNLVPIYRMIPNLKPLIQIHDDIVWEADEDSLDTCIPIIKAVMEDSAPKGFLVPLEVDFKVGRKWGSMKKYKG